MKAFRKNIMPLIVLLVIGGIAKAQSFPIVLTQKLPWAPSTIEASATKDISVVYDTANYIAIVTYGTLEEADSLRFPEGKIKFDSESRKLSFNSNDFPYNSGIQVHTNSKNLTLNAKGYSKITLSSMSDKEIHLQTLTLNAENGSIIEVTHNVVADEAYIDAKDYGWIRYRKIEAKRKKTNAYGSARVIEIGGNVQESFFSPLTRDYREIPMFADWSVGICTLGSTPFGGFNAPTGNFIWGIRSVSYFSLSARWAFYQKSHWDISAGLGMNTGCFRADNAYLSLETDAETGITDLKAINASALFIREEQMYGKILWGSDFLTTALIFPIRLEWRSRADYKGLHIGGELRPGFAVARKRSTLHRHGHYMEDLAIARTSDERLGKFIYPFQLGLRLDIGYNRVSFFAETLLTPLFRTRGDNTPAKPVMGQKLYPFSVGISFTY